MLARLKIGRRLPPNDLESTNTSSQPTDQSATPTLLNQSIPAAVPPMDAKNSHEAHREDFFHSPEAMDAKNAERYLASPTSEVTALPSDSDPLTTHSRADSNGKQDTNVNRGGPAVGEDSEGYLKGIPLWMAYLAMLLSIFLVSLDFTIIGPSLGKIADRFEALQQIGWISSAFFLTQAPFTLWYSQVLTIARAKTVLLVAILIFELGSLLCAVAPNVEVLILGRAVAGVGGGGIFIGVLNLIAQAVPLRLRSALMGGFGAVYGVSCAIGPLLGGAFTDSKVTWRACFWINLPIGLISVVVIFFIVKSKPSHAENNPDDNRTTLERWKSLDWIGGLLFLGLTTSLILALSWGGNTKPWKDASVIACFCVFGALLPTFLLWSRHRGDTALLPLAFLRDRSVVGASLSLFLMFAVLISIAYYLPLQYQAVDGASATKSGIKILPFMMSAVACSIISGAITGITGDYWISLVVFPMILIPIGGGLFQTISASTSDAKLAGYQILVGAGCGFAIQSPLISLNAIYHDRPALLPQATGIASCIQLLGSVIGIAIAQVILTNGLSKYISPLGLDDSMIRSIKSSVEIVKTLPDDIRAQVIDAYVKSLRNVYAMAIPAGLLVGVSAMMIKRVNVKQMGIQMGGAA